MALGNWPLVVMTLSLGGNTQSNAITWIGVRVVIVSQAVFKEGDLLVRQHNASNTFKRQHNASDAKEREREQEIGGRLQRGHSWSDRHGEWSQSTEQSVLDREWSKACNKTGLNSLTPGGE